MDSGAFGRFVGGGSSSDPVDLGVLGNELWLMTTAAYILKDGVLTGFTRRTLDGRDVVKSRVVDLTPLPAVAKKTVANRKTAKRRTTSSR